MVEGTSVAVIGLGSRGLGVLERLVTTAKRAGAAAGRLRVDVVDPRCDGAGVHDRAQPDYLLLNTTCAHVSMFADEHTVGEEVDAPGPSLYTWVTGRGLRMGADGYTVGTSGRDIRPTDFLPRRILGEYLGWCLDEVIRRRPGHVEVVLHRTSAVDLTSEPDGSITVTLADGDPVTVDHVFLTTGYTANAEPPSGVDGAARLISEPYPLPDRLAAVRPGQTVAIAGFGLSALDVMAALTVGRGGRFVYDGIRASYEPSGDEPTMLFYSRSGTPCRARPLVVEFGPKHPPLVLTHEAIDGLRVVRGGSLDFQADIMPLVFVEMRAAYRLCQARLAGGDAEAELLRHMRSAGDVGELLALLDKLDAQHGGFDAEAIFLGTHDMPLTDADAYQGWMLDVIEADLREGVRGFTGSPLKAGLDVLRQLRDTMRYIVDYGGLTAASLEDFNGRIVPLINRAVVGPQFERHAELAALVRAGLAVTRFGPAPRVAYDADARRWTIESTRLATAYRAGADWLCAGYVGLPTVGSSASPLLRSLYEKGWLRPFAPGSRSVVGADVDADQHPRGRDGQPDRRIWMLGPLHEGATFYTNLVPSPQTWSRPIFDAHRCVAAMFSSRRATAAA